MKSLKLNGSGDIEFDNLYELKMNEGLNEIKQRTKLSIGTNQGEWFLNIIFGIPWIDMLSRGAPEKEYRKEILKVLNNDPAIDEIKNINLDFDREDRNLVIEFKVIADEESFNERVVI